MKKMKKSLILLVFFLTNIFASDNLETCLSGKYPSLCNHNILTDKQKQKVREAKEMGVKFVVNTDVHSIKQLDNMPFGINQARRGWLESDSVINCEDLSF